MFKPCIYRKTKPPNSAVCNCGPVSITCSRMQQTTDEHICNQCLFSKSILETQGRGFKFNNDKSITYAQTTFEPPKLMEGYERDKENPFVLRSVWPNCKYLELKFKPTKACGCLTLDARCSKNDCTAKFDQCKECQEKEPNV